MSDFSVFMAGNVQPNETVKYVASKRIGREDVNDEGKLVFIPEPWELKAIDTALDEQLRKECTKKVQIQGKRGQYTMETDNDAYLAKLCVATIIYPNLNNVELQSNHGVMDGVALLKKLLNSGEYTELKAKVMEVNGYDVSMEELVDEAKN